MRNPWAIPSLFIAALLLPTSLYVNTLIPFLSLPLGFVPILMGTNGYTFTRDNIEAGGKTASIISIILGIIIVLLTSMKILV